MKNVEKKPAKNIVHSEAVLLEPGHGFEVNLVLIKKEPLTSTHLIARLLQRNYDRSLKILIFKVERRNRYVRYTLERYTGGIN